MINFSFRNRFSMFGALFGKNRILKILKNFNFTLY